MALQEVIDLETILGQANIAHLLEEDDLKKISVKVLEEYRIDENSNEDWTKKTKDAMDLAKQVVEIKNTPWKNASNVKYPLITVAAIQFAARAYPAIVSGRQVVKGKVIGSDKGIPKVDAKGQQIADENGQPAWKVPPGAKKARADRIADHMSYQFLEEMEEWEDETDYLLHAVPIVGCMFRKIFYDPELGRNRSKVLWPDQVIVNKEVKSLDAAARATECFKLYPFEIEERKRAALWLDVDIDYKDEEESLEEFIEQHTRIDMDGDGYPEPYIVTVHVDSGELMRIAPNYDSSNILMAGKRIRKITPLKYYVKYMLLPDPDGGFYGMGFGQLMLPINESVNTLVNQLIDAGTLANRGGGFIGRGIRMKKGDTAFKIGEFKTVDVGVGSLRDNILPLPVRDPSNVLFLLLGMLIDAAKDISSVQDVTTGKLQQAQQPTTTLALIEQGEMVFTGIFKRIHRSLKKEAMLLYKLNAKFLTDQEYFNVLDNPQAIARSDYGKDVAVVPVSDPNMVSSAVKQKRAELLQPLIGLPWINGMKITERFLEAIGVENPEELFITPQPDPEVLEMIARLENDRMRAEATVFETKIKAVELVTRAVKNLSDAKDRKEDKEIKTIMATLAVLANYIGVLDVRTDTRVAGTSGNDGVPAIAQG